MIEIKDFRLSSKSSQITCSEEGLFSDEGFIKLKQIQDYLLENGYCHVRVNGGDYDGSIAKFTPDTPIDEKFYWRINCREVRWGVKYYWWGRLSWKGKRNNPKFTLASSDCDVILDYDGDEILKRIDTKKEKEKLLENPVEDIDGKVLSKGDQVLYMNLRYGSGGKLCHGKVKDFKAHARDKYVSVIVTNNDSPDEESECRQPWNQVYKMQ
ncbi:hypothetical protein VPHG_00120 [Vibrio phage 11895-B1]|uniref:hypothetical protein n=1 Tax=Vibrio phage 11895-B1 TaxID=754075 RepID=UPI0002C13671|nr:hypothetical protein VPHG_00120 [Vibrio phage 11895-B1]AGH32187.1 hypothetical protein VPHG_00120 [Vibrio phage 11895-B1]